MASKPYCAIGDVNALVPQAPFSASSKPADKQVERLIEQISKRVDATLGNVGYEVPVTVGARSLDLLREAVAWGACGLAQMSRETGVRVATSDKGASSTNFWTTQFEQWLKRLTDPQNPFELPDATRTNEQLFKQGENVLRSHVQSDTDRFVDSPVVTRDQVL